MSKVHRCGVVAHRQVYESSYESSHNYEVLSICLSVRLSHAGSISKQLYGSVWVLLHAGFSRLIIHSVLGISPKIRVLLSAICSKLEEIWPHTQRPALYTARWLIRREAASRGSFSVSWHTCMQSIVFTVFIFLFVRLLWHCVPCTVFHLSVK